MYKIKGKIKLFVWNNFVERYYKDWLEDYADECNQGFIESEHENYLMDLD